jgi:hypothetical protein
MAVQKLESLVLRGVSVLRDGQVVNPRLGTGYQAIKQVLPSLTMRHPSPDYRQVFTPPAAAIEPAVSDRRDDAEVGGAGRSRWRAGVSVVWSCSRTLGKTIPSGWSLQRGGREPMVNANLCSKQAHAAVSVGEAARLKTVPSPRTPPALAGFGSQPSLAQAPWKRTGVGRTCHKQSDRISTASSRSK